jgi:hypothetical protein
MTEKEVDIVAEELARLGGTCWYPGRNDDPVLRVVTERYRLRARAAIAALERHRAAAEKIETETSSQVDTDIVFAHPPSERLRLGATVIYRPPGDRRAYSCIVDEIADGAVHVVPQIPGWDGWVREADVITEAVIQDIKDEVSFPSEASQLSSPETDIGPAR